MNEILQQFEKLGIIPVVKIDRAEDAEALAGALCDGGLPVAEVTFRTDAAEEAIRRMTAHFPEMLVGAGTVLTTEQADRAVNAGARFIVSPGLNPKVVAHCREIGVPVVPGVNTPSEIEQALEFGLEVVKFFPAEASGGLAKIKAMSAPYGNLRFMPTGGINADNLKSYLDFKKILACGGSWMVSSDLINRGEFDQIKALTKEAVDKMLGFKIKHVGINIPEGEAGAFAGDISDIFALPVRETGISYFCGSSIEVMKGMGPGANGHIAMQTNYVERAIYYLEKKGLEFDYDTVLTDKDGKIMFIYLKKDFGGFRIHLCKPD